MEQQLFHWQISWQHSLGLYCLNVYVKRCLKQLHTQRERMFPCFKIDQNVALTFDLASFIWAELFNIWNLFAWPMKVIIPAAQNLPRQPSIILVKVTQHGKQRRLLHISSLFLSFEWGWHYSSGECAGPNNSLLKQLAVGNTIIRGLVKTYKCKVCNLQKKSKTQFKTTTEQCRDVHYPCERYFQEKYSTFSKSIL